MTDLSPIDQRWIQHYCDQLLAVAEQLPQGSMREALFSRIEHAMDLVEAWRTRNTPPSLPRQYETGSE